MNFNNGREAKEENGIRQPKSILHAMTSDPSYFEPKMRLLQTITGLNFLEEEFTSEEDDRIERNDIFIGYKIFDSLDTVKNRFKNGKALSCFCIDGKDDQVHVAFKVPKQNFCRITYVTFRMEYTMKEEAGVHFRRFVLLPGNTQIDRGSDKITDFAIMLPYWHKGCFVEQFTLIYSDWDVLRNESHNATKGPTPVSKNLFDEIIRQT